MPFPDFMKRINVLTYFKVRRTILMQILEPLTENLWSSVVRAEKKARK
jgi:hypothetical protein